MNSSAPAGLGQLKQIAMAVADVTRATRFYRDTLGVPFLFAAGPTLSFFDLAGVRLMLSLPEAGIEPPGSVLYFATDDISQTHAALAAKGVRFRTAPHRVATLADREVWLADFEDGEGNILALMSEPPVAR
jgi:methylmalonyl-CoA/ethylmalonyl-CoA epimerase